jgi:hypothetical protein
MIGGDCGRFSVLMRVVEVVNQVEHLLVVVLALGLGAGSVLAQIQ